MRPYVGGPKPGKRGRGAAGKSKVMVAVETPGDKPRFAAMREVPRVSANEIKAMAQACLAAEVVARTDGWKAYRAELWSSFHIPTVTGSGKKRGQIVSLGPYPDRQRQRQYSWSVSWRQ